MTSYQLYAAGSAQLLSCHMTYEAGLVAADAYTLALLAVATDWVTVETWIVGPGLNGPLTVHPVVTHVGPPTELEECRKWLARLRSENV
jgi:hypothetical protein